MIWRSILVIGVLCSLSAVAQAQEGNNEQKAAMDQIIELVSENLETEDLDFTNLLEDLNYFYRHPINLNKTTREDLEKLFVLDEFQISALFNHIRVSGKLLTIYELQSVSGFDQNTIESILPFVRVGDGLDQTVLTWESIRKEGKHDAFVRYQQVVEPMVGYSPSTDSTLAASPNSRYLGGPQRVFTRYRFRYANNISIGVTGEKDAGEQFFAGSNKRGFDFYSAHAYFGNYGRIKHAIIGDYQIQFGQGLTYWTGLAFGKSTNLNSIKRSAREITPYVSAMESNFQRGAAATLEFGKIEVTGFVSNQKVDANATVADTTDDNQVEVTEFSSFQQSGYHRTPGELQDKKSITELNTGGHVRFRHDDFQVGFTGVFTRYSGNLQPPTALYRSMEPYDRSFVVAGMDYQYRVANILGFGEISQQLNGGAAFTNGAMISLDPRMDLVVLYRNFSAAYSNPRSNAVSESSRNNNEQGLYLGLSSKLNSKWTYTSYFDLFLFPWLRFQADAPTRGKEFLAQLEYKPNKRFTIFARYRIEDKEESFTLAGQPTSAIGERNRTWQRLQMSYAVSKTISVRSRVEYTTVKLPEGDKEQGWLIYQDVAYKPQWPAKYEFRFRYAIFDTDGYDSRMYAYEQDVPYSFSVPAYFGRGNRIYLILNYDINSWSQVILRVAQTYYASQSANGSGLNQVEGPTRTEVKVQLSVRF